MTRTPSLVTKLEAYIEQYVTFANPAYAFVAALWTIATHCFSTFDAFPYVVITSPVKRSGKTRFSEILSFLVHRARRLIAATAHSVFAEMPVVDVQDGDEGMLDDVSDRVLALESHAPVLFNDEAETLSREDAGDLRAVLNGGYRKGATVTRRGITYAIYSPKVFILIGDVFDTLRDRSIVIEMWRGEPRRRFLFASAKAEGNEIKRELTIAVAANKDAITTRYREIGDLPFLMDRDAEIWTALFTIAEVFCPDRLAELRRVAVDLATLKTQERRDYRALAGLEATSEQHDYAVRLLRDLHTVLDGKRLLYTTDAITALQAIDTAPWRTFRGEGLNAYNMADLLRPMGVAPILLKTGTKRAGKKVARGYRREDVERAIKKL